MVQGELVQVGLGEVEANLIEDKTIFYNKPHSLVNGAYFYLDLSKYFLHFLFNECFFVLLASCLHLTEDLDGSGFDTTELESHRSPEDMVIHRE